MSKEVIEEKEELIEEEAQHLENGDTKWFTSAFNRTKDKKFIRQVEMMKRVTGVSNADLFKMGCDAYKETDDYAEAMKEFADMKK